MILWKIVYNRNFEEFYKTDWGNWKWKLLPHVKEITVGQAHKNTWKLKRNISHFPFPYFELFVLRYFPFHVVCFVLLHVFSSFFVRYLFVLPRPLMYPFSKYLRKTTVSYEIFRLSFRVFLCAGPTVISLIFPLPYFALFVPRYFPFHVLWLKSSILKKFLHTQVINWMYHNHFLDYNNIQNLKKWPRNLIEVQNLHTIFQIPPADEYNIQM
jgi:hypothetical protein